MARGVATIHGGASAECLPQALESPQAIWLSQPRWRALARATGPGDKTSTESQRAAQLKFDEVLELHGQSAGDLLPSISSEADGAVRALLW